METGSRWWWPGLGRAGVSGWEDETLWRCCCWRPYNHKARGDEPCA